MRKPGGNHTVNDHPPEGYKRIQSLSKTRTTSPTQPTLSHMPCSRYQMVQTWYDWAIGVISSVEGANFDIFPTANLPGI